MSCERGDDGSRRAVSSEKSQDARQDSKSRTVHGQQLEKAILLRQILKLM